MVSDVRDFYRQQRTCCLALPLFQGGLVTILYFNLFFAAFCCAMAAFGPKILALVLPKVLSYAFAAMYAAVAALHVWGLVAVERSGVVHFRQFKLATLGVLGLIFSLSLIFILATAAQHSSSITQCMAVYHLPVNASFKKKLAQSKVTTRDNALNAAMTVCDLFTWFQVGVMAVAWVVMALVQFYFASKYKVYYVLKHQDYLEDQARQ